MGKARGIYEVGMFGWQKEIFNQMCDVVDNYKEKRIGVTLAGRASGKTFLLERLEDYMRQSDPKPKGGR